MRILISAAEASSDAHGAELLKALQMELKSLGKSCEAFGIGGPKLKETGLHAVVDARELSVMGSTEVLGVLPRIFRALAQITEVASQKKPVLAIVLDYPDFHFRLARKLKKLGIPIVYYIPPKVWIWRKRRVYFLKKFFVRILCIFPFEEAFYKKYQIPVSYVGNPLVDELPVRRYQGELPVRSSQMESRIRLSLKESDKVLVLMPGSRKAELKAHMEVMLDAAAKASEQLVRTQFLEPGQTLHVLMPFPHSGVLQEVQARLEAVKFKYSKLLTIHLSIGNAHECLIAADAGLIKSGTSTLEAGLLRCPHSIIYKPSRMTAWVFKVLIRYSGPVGLVNLVLNGKPEDPYLVSEFLMDQVQCDTLSAEIVSLMTDQKRRQLLFSGFDCLMEKVYGNPTGLSPSVCAAREVIEVLRNLGTFL